MFAIRVIKLTCIKNKKADDLLDHSIDDSLDEIYGDIQENCINQMEISNEENCDDEDISQDISLQSVYLDIAQKDKIGFENNENTSDFDEQLSPEHLYMDWNEWS